MKINKGRPFISYCTDENSVIDSINNNIQIICLERKVFKNCTREWDDYFTSLLDSYKQQNKWYIRHKMLCGRVMNVMLSKMYIIYVKENYSYYLSDADMKIPINNKPNDYNSGFKNNNYFKNLLYDSVTMSYHENFQNRPNSI